MQKGRIDWNAIRAEYIGGGTSYRKLAEKYQVPFYQIRERGAQEQWVKLAEQARNKACIKSVQKTADQASENAITAARIKEKLLKKIEAEIDSLPENMGTEYREGGEEIGFVRVRRIRDLTASYKDLTADMPRGDSQTEETLQRAWEILGGVQSAIQ